MSNNRNDGLVGALILATGLIVGAATTLLIKENKPMHAGKVLEKIKSDFKKLGPIEGSWINYDSVPYDRFNSQPLVYLGGISKFEDGELKSYQFASDIYTGEILDLIELP